MSWKLGVWLLLMASFHVIAQPASADSPSYRCKVEEAGGLRLEGNDYSLTLFNIDYDYRLVPIEKAFKGIGSDREKLGLAIRINNKIKDSKATGGSEESIRDWLEAELREIERADVIGQFRYVLRKTTSDPAYGSSFISCKDIGLGQITCSNPYFFNTYFILNTETGRFGAATLDPSVGETTRDSVLRVGTCTRYFD